MMRVMVIESDRQSAEHEVRSLREAGHEVVRCHEPGEQVFPCNALCDDHACPLEGGEGVDVVLDHRAHPYPRPTPLEDGATCARPQHIPFVVSGTAALNPFEPWTTAVADDGDIVATCVTVARAPLQRLAEPARLAGLAPAGRGIRP